MTQDTEEGSDRSYPLKVRETSRPATRVVQLSNEPAVVKDRRSLSPAGGMCRLCTHESLGLPTRGLVWGGEDSATSGKHAIRLPS